MWRGIKRKLEAAERAGLTSVRYTRNTTHGGPVIVIKDLKTGERWTFDVPGFVAGLIGLTFSLVAIGIAGWMEAGFIGFLLFIISAIAICAIFGWLFSLLTRWSKP
jgi:hypothetical protein